jgi:two-component system, sensor histidine kinase RegB
LARWRTLWPQASCILALETAGVAPQIAVETALEQAITNLLNNAAKSTPYGLRLVVTWDARTVRIAVRDQGPGFPPEILQVCGAMPIAAHPEGAGIGLWLTRAAVERLGGSLALENQSTGGVATITLPMASGSKVEGQGT